MKRFKREGGFSLIELMVVILIIGILVAIAIPVYNIASANAQRRACQANLRILNGACVTYRATVAGGAYPAELVNLAPDFIQAVPVCPAAGAYTYAPATGTTTCSIPDHKL